MSFGFAKREDVVHRRLSLDELQNLLGAMNAEIAALPDGPRKDEQIAHRLAIEADIKMLRWAHSPSLKPPSS